MIKDISQHIFFLIFLNFKFFIAPLIFIFKTYYLGGGRPYF